MKLHRSLSAAIAILALTALAPGADIFKSATAGGLNTAEAWVGNAVPGPGDVAVWDNAAATLTNTTLGDSMTWRGLRVVTWSLSPTVRGTTGKILKLGNAGVDLSASSVDLTFNTAMQVELAASQTWKVGSGRTFTAGALTGGGFTLTKDGEGVVKLSGTAASYAGALQLTAGSVQVINASGTQELAGPLSGTGALGKTEGGGGLTLSADNSAFSGSVTLAAGQLNLNHPKSLGGGVLTVTGGSLGNTSGGTLTLAAGEQNWSGDFGYSGSSDLNLGASAVTVSGSRTLTVNANTLTASGILGGSGGLTKAGSGTLRVVAGADITLGGKLGVTGGPLKIDGGTATCGAAFEVGGSGLLELNGGALTVPAMTGAGGASTVLFNGGVLRAGGSPSTFMGGIGTAKVSTGGLVFDPNGYTATISQALTHDAALGATADGGLRVRSDFGGTVKLTGASTYTGPTVIETGTLELGAGGSVNASPVIELAAEGALDGGTAGATLASGQTLLGHGAVFGKLTLAPGATLAPGDAGVGTEYGTLRMPGKLVLKGNAMFQIRKGGGAIDTMTELDKVTYGGTLTLIAAPGTFFAAGDSFKLFDALEYAGGFSTLDLPALPSGNYWEPATLNVDGTLTVINTLPVPMFNPAAGVYLGAQLVTISGMAGSMIHYTTDGSDPLVSATVISAASPVVEVAIPINSKDFTIKAYTTRAGASPSVVATAVYQTVDTPTWVQEGSGNWSDPANWLGEYVAGGSGQGADLSTLTMSGGFAVTLDGPRVIGRLKFGDVGNAFGWSLLGSALTLDGGASQPVMVVNNGTLATNIALQGTQGFVKEGAGTWNLNGDQALTGPIVINGGVLMTGGGNSANGAIGAASSITINAATVGCAGDNSLIGWGAKSLPITLNTGAVLTGNAGTATNLQELTFAGGELASAASTHGTYGSWNIQKNITVTENSAISAKNIQFSLATPVITVAAGKSLNVSGFFENSAKTGVRPLTKSGEGTLIMGGPNTYTGATSLNGGTLLVNGSLAAASSVTAAAGTTLGGTGTAAGSVTINTGAFLAPGANGAGVLATAALALTGTYRCEVDGTTCDQLVVSGNLNLTGSTLEVAVLAGGSGGGPYVIATFTGTRTGTFANVPAGYTVDYSVPNQVKLTVSGSGDAFATWLAGYGLAGANALPGTDPDRDGISNAIEFVLGGNPASVMDAALLPVIALVINPGGMVPAGSYLRFTYRRTPASAYLNPGMQYDADLAGIWTAAVAGQAGVVEVVTPGFFTVPAPADKVEVYVPRAGNEAGGRLFGRLRVSVP